MSAPADTDPDALAQREHALFLSLLELSPAAQRAQLAARCADEPVLAERLRALLALDAEAEGGAAMSWAALPLTEARGPALVSAGSRVGDYEVEHRLGVGGMAEVWAVRHVHLRSEHALKVLLWASDTLQQRLLREGRAQARLRHPNIVPVHEVIDLAGTPALVMARVRGPSLRALLGAHRLSRSAALAIFSAVLDGVSHAHALGLIHRDLKPANILLDVRYGVICPRVADFGLVKDIAGSLYTQVGVAMGTPAYAAPEQLQDASVADARADLFALGVLLCELLIGTRPFAGSSIAELALAHRGPPDLDGLDDAARPVVAALLQHDPEARPASCAQLRSMLEAIAPEPLRAGPLVARVAALGEQAAPAVPSIDPDMTPHNLPARRDRFVGRADERLALRQLLASPRGRLVTVTGMGGCGKTRLALEEAWRLRSVCTGGVWFVDLAEARSQEDIWTKTAQSLGVPLPRAPQATLRAALASLGSALVILDNVEQIAEETAAVVGDWLDGAPGVRFLATSRVPLRVRGEQLLPLGVLCEDDAVDLFVQRAQQLSATISLDAGQRQQLAELVAMLDRLPLAIELAAARSRMLSPAALLRRLEKRFDVLKSRSRDLPARQRTLWATLQWSWELLSPDEQAVFAQCSVFEGGMRLEDAESVIVCADDAAWVEDVLAELVDKNLLASAVERDGESRLRMLVSVQAFVRRKLDADPEQMRAVQQRHGACFAARSRSSRLQQARWLVEEKDNLLAAIERAVHRQDAETAVACAQAVSEVYRRHGPFEEGLAMVETLGDRITLTGSQQLRLLSDTPRFFSSLNRRGEGLERAQRLHALARGCGDVLLQLEATRELGVQLMMQFRHEEAEGLLRPALATARRDGLLQVEADILCNLGSMSSIRGQRAAAEEIFGKALLCYQRLQDRRGEAFIREHLGSLYVQRSDWDGAWAAFNESLALYREYGDRPREANLLLQISRLHEIHLSFDEAEHYFGQAQQIFEQIGDRSVEAKMLSISGRLRARQEDWDVAVDLMERALVLLRAQETSYAVLNTVAYLGDILRQKGDLDRSEVYYAEAMEIAVSMKRSASVTLLHYNIGLLYTLQGRLDDALESLLEAQRTHDVLGRVSFQQKVLDALIDVYAQKGLEADLSRCRQQRAALGEAL